jgi:lipoprotein-anchoring transpeptidase ErfK/SrfK
MRAVSFFLTAAGVVWVTSCAQFRGGLGGPAGAPEAASAEDVAKADEFFKNGGKGGFHPEPKETPKLTPQNSGMVVELDQQRAYLYYGGRLLAVSKISSGRSHYRTETGHFVLGQKDLNHRSNLYGDFVEAHTGTVMLKDVTHGFDPVPVEGQFQGALMRYFQRFDKPGRGPTAMGLHAGVVPSYPASHGCVRLPASMAKWFYENVPIGTPVVIRGTKFGVPYGATQDRPKRQPKVHPSLQEPVPPPQTPPPGAEDAPPPVAGQPAPNDAGIAVEAPVAAQ